jgi:hypothetical protein
MARRVRHARPTPRYIQTRITVQSGVPSAAIRGFHTPSFAIESIAFRYVNDVHGQQKITLSH